MLRLVLPLAACALAIAAEVAGGACSWPKPAPPPPLRSGNYVLTLPNGHVPPGIITDSAGRRLRVIADTFAIVTSDMSYEERATVAITPPAGTEQPPGPFTSSRRHYGMANDFTAVFQVTLYGGAVQGIIGENSLTLQMPDRTAWRYDLR